MKTRTTHNLQKAMQAEAFAYAQCSRFAAAAKIHGDCAVANTFESVAEMDRYGHFTQEFVFSSSGGSEAENLEAACKFKLFQIDMYSQFIREAVQDGETETATLFERIRAEEVGQLEMLRTAMQGAPKLFEEFVAA